MVLDVGDAVHAKVKLLFEKDTTDEVERRATHSVIDLL